MTHTLDEIKKMLKEITVWPVMEVGAGPIIIDCHEIISELVEEVQRLRGALDEMANSISESSFLFVREVLGRE